MPQTITRYNPAKLPELIEELKKRPLSSKECAAILEMKTTNANVINNIISYLSIDYPIFEEANPTRKGYMQYRLLTPELLEHWEQEELARRRKKYE